MDVETLKDNLESVVLYLAIALIGAYIAVGLLVWFFKREKFSDFKKYVVGITVGFAVCTLVLLSYVEFQCKKDDMQARLFYPILATLIVAVVGATAMLVSSLFNRKAVKISGFVTILLLVGCFIATMVEMSVYYEGIAGDENLVGLIVSAIVFMALIVAFWFLGDKQKANDTRAIVYGAISIALSFALSYARLFKLPQGGSVTFASLLPLMIYCCMFGTRRGIVVCLVYGVLQALQDPYIIHPMQFLLDYPLAFGVIGVSGIFMEKGVFKSKRVLAFLTGGVLAVVLRYVCHVLTGVFAFASYADVAKYGTVVVYSMAYNSFAFVDMAIALVAGSTLFASKTFVSLMQKSSDNTSVVAVDEEEDDVDEIDLQIMSAQAVSQESIDGADISEEADAVTNENQSGNE